MQVFEREALARAVVRQNEFCSEPVALSKRMSLPTMPSEFGGPATKAPATTTADATATGGGAAAAAGAAAVAGEEDDGATTAESVEHSVLHRAVPLFVAATHTTIETALADGVDVSARADSIMRAEPAIERGTAAAAGYAFTEIGHAAHGTTLAAALSALRNTSAQLVPVKELGELRGTGATPEESLKECSILNEVVFAADLLHFGGAAAETAEQYARKEAGVEEKCRGARTVRRSEASLVPAVLVGDLTDPQGKGAALNMTFQNEQVFKKEAFETQIIGERMRIRSIFVAHPTDPDEDGNVVELTKELVRRAVAEQGQQVHGGGGGCESIHIGMLRGAVAEFKQAHAGKQAVTRADLRALLPPAVSGE